MGDIVDHDSFGRNGGKFVHVLEDFLLGIREECFLNYQLNEIMIQHE